MPELLFIFWKNMLTLLLACIELIWQKSSIRGKAGQTRHTTGYPELNVEDDPDRENQ